MSTRASGHFLLPKIIILHVCIVLLSFPHLYSFISRKSSFEFALAVDSEFLEKPLTGINLEVVTSDSLWNTIQNDPLLSDLTACIESVSPAPKMVDFLQKENNSATHYTFLAPTNDANVKEWCNSIGSLSSDKSGELNMYLSYWTVKPANGIDLTILYR